MKSELQRLVSEIGPTDVLILMPPGGRFKNAYELLNLRALKISIFYKIISFNVWVRYFLWNFKGTLSNSTQNILSIH